MTATAPSGRSLAVRAKKGINTALLRTTGYELKRRTRGRPPGKRIEQVPVPPDPAELAGLVDRARRATRLLSAPTFILSSVRSGSTLLRLLLNSHPAICAPHELHLRRIGVRLLGHGRYALETLGLDDREVRNLLWDRILHRELLRSGKTRFVNKTPTDALMWPDILACWPDARFVFLQRHPAAIVDSWHAARQSDLTREEAALDVLAYATGMEQAREMHGGLVVRYEELTREPERVTRQLCRFIGVDWTPSMIDYGAAAHDGLRRGLGDWSERMRSGAIQPVTALPPPERIPGVLRPIARSWGYLPASLS